MGGGKSTFSQQQARLHIVPHARTLRKAREQVKCMVADGLSARQIRNYLARWSQWWQNTTTIWSTNKLIQWFCKACWDLTPAVYAAGILLRRIRESHTHLPYARHVGLDTLQLAG